MKLHLPTPLRAAVLSCMVAAATLGSTLATGTLAGSALMAVIATAPAAQATTTAPAFSGGTLNLNSNSKVTITGTSASGSYTYTVEYQSDGGTTSSLNKQTTTSPIQVAGQTAKNPPTDDMDVTIDGGSYEQVAFLLNGDGVLTEERTLSLTVKGGASIGEGRTDYNRLFGYNNVNANWNGTVHVTVNAENVGIMGATLTAYQCNRAGSKVKGDIAFTMETGTLKAKDGVSLATGAQRTNLGEAGSNMQLTYTFGSQQSSEGPTVEGSIVATTILGGNTSASTSYADAVINLYSGTFKGSIYAISTGTYAAGGTYTVNYGGGTFDGNAKIGVLGSSNATFSGTATLNVLSGATLLTSRVDVADFNALNIANGGVLEVDTELSSSALGKISNNGTILLGTGGSFDLSTFEVLSEEISDDQNSITATFLLFDSDNGMGQYEGFSSSDGYTVDEQEPYRYLSADGAER